MSRREVITIAGMHPGTAGVVLFTALVVLAAVIIAVVWHRERGTGGGA